MTIHESCLWRIRNADGDGFLIERIGASIYDIALNRVILCRHTCLPRKGHGMRPMCGPLCCLRRGGLTMLDVCCISVLLRNFRFVGRRGYPARPQAGHHLCAAHLSDANRADEHSDAKPKVHRLRHPLQSWSPFYGELQEGSIQSERPKAQLLKNRAQSGSGCGFA